MINPLTGMPMLASAEKYVEDLQVERIRLARTVKRSGSPTKRLEAAQRIVEIDTWIEQAYIGEYNQRL